MDDRSQVFRKELLETRPKIRFTGKLQRVLKFSSEAPELIGLVGAMWMPDGKTFAANTVILGRYLGIERNTITHDFRDHQITTFNPSGDLIAFIQTLSGGGHWKCHQHLTGQFTSHTTAEEAAHLDAELRLKLPPGAEAAPMYVAAARQHWFLLFGAADAAPLDKLAEALVPGEGAAAEQLKTNCRHLFGPGVDIVTQTVGFATFAAVFYRYGSPGGVAAQIGELTPEWTLDASRPCFYAGIWVGIDHPTCLKQWRTASVDMWALLEGADAGTFQLLTKQRLVDRGADCRRTITIDPLAEIGRWRISEGAGKIVSVNNFELVLRYFGLSPGSGVRLPEPHHCIHMPWVSRSQTTDDIGLFQPELVPSPSDLVEQEFVWPPSDV
jgi:hypothetical protein